MSRPTIVNHDTGEIIDRPTHAEVRESIETTKSHLERAAEQVVWQIESRAWDVLGYTNWDEMREAEYKGAAVIVPAADRPELSSRLRATGLTNQQVAETIGVSEATVRNDNRNSAITPATVTDRLGRERPTSYTPKTSSSAPSGFQTDEAAGISQVDEEAAPMVGAGDSPEAGGYLSAHQPPAEPDAVGDFLDGSQALQDARYLANFYKAITKASDYRIFDAERIGRIGNDADMRTLELAAKSATEFYEAAKRARSGLRVIKGGRA